MAKLVMTATAAATPPPRDRSPARPSGGSIGVLERGYADVGLDSTLADLMQEAIAVCEEVERRRTAVDSTRRSWADLRQTKLLWEKYEHAKHRLDDLQEKVAEHIRILEPRERVPNIQAGHRPGEPSDSDRLPGSKPALVPEATDPGDSWQPPEEVLEVGREGMPPGNNVGGRAAKVTPSKVDVSSHPETIRSAQRQADAELVAILRAQDFTGPAFNRFLNSLARYGLDVIGSWVRSEDIFVRCAARGVKGLPSSTLRLWSAQDLEEIVQDTVAQALVAFETDALRGHRWQPDAGASLATYFIGTCIYAFADIYRRRIARWQRDLAVKQALIRDPLPDVPDVADIVSDSDIAQRFMSAPQDQTLKRVIYLSYEGHTHDEIAAELDDGTTPRAIEGMLYRYRKQFLRKEENRDDQ